MEGEFVLQSIVVEKHGYHWHTIDGLGIHVDYGWIGEKKKKNITTRVRGDEKRRIDGLIRSGAVHSEVMDKGTRFLRVKDAESLLYGLMTLQGVVE